MTTGWTKTFPFKVDISGIIELMGASIYSRPDTPIRELIQNAHDGIIRRRQSDLKLTGRIDIVQDIENRTLTFSDDGIGMNAEEAETYLGTLGVGITGVLRRRNSSEAVSDGGSLIGQFGIGLFSAFLLAEKLVVETRRIDGTEGVRWEAGAGTDVSLSWCDRSVPGTSVTLHLREDATRFAEDREYLESVVKEFADFLPIPIFLNQSATRVNVCNVAWFDPTPDREAIELELEGYFHETPMEVIPVRQEKPVSLAGALYVSPQRTPGFTEDQAVAVTVRRMVISRRIQGLLPEWASFLRGVLELNDCSPTASREDLVRNFSFSAVQKTIEFLLYDHFERLARQDPSRLQAIIAWHRYTFAGAALTEQRMRNLLRKTYKFPTSQGVLSFEEILNLSAADPLFENDATHVIWFNTDRRQESWANALFANQSVPCVHTLLSFEESLLTAMSGEASREGKEVDLRIATPSSRGFTESILEAQDVQEAPREWQEFLSATGAKVYLADFHESRPVMGFLNERRELRRVFEELKQQGNIPSGFQRLIDAKMQEEAEATNELLLNRRHRLVGRALEQSTRTPLASVLRQLAFDALASAGAILESTAQQQRTEDLDWIAEALWGKKS
jgi:molecular chaperone HtpG